MQCKVCLLEEARRLTIYLRLDARGQKLFAAADFHPARPYYPRTFLSQTGSQDGAVALKSSRSRTSRSAMGEKSFVMGLYSS
jgi:hypothetical protein